MQVFRFRVVELPICSSLSISQIKDDFPPPPNTKCWSNENLSFKLSWSMANFLVISLWFLFSLIRREARRFVIRDVYENLRRHKADIYYGDIYVETFLFKLIRSKFFSQYIFASKNCYVDFFWGVEILNRFCSFRLGAGFLSHWKLKRKYVLGRLNSKLIRGKINSVFYKH